MIDLDYQFIQEFYLYLKIHRNIDTNTSNKYITHLKKVVNLAIDYNWLDKNPFNNFKLKNKQVHHTPLSADEINKTRVRYNQIVADVCKKTLDEVSKDADRDFWMSPAEANTYGMVSKVITSFAMLK